MKLQKAKFFLKVFVFASSAFLDVMHCVEQQDQWMSPKSSTTKPGNKTGGMKTSTSAPSGLPSAKTPPKSSLFDEEEDDDLFAPPKESRYLQL